MHTMHTHIYIIQVLNNFFIRNIILFHSFSTLSKSKVIIWIGKEVIFLCLKDSIAIRRQMSIIMLTLERKSLLKSDNCLSRQLSDFS